MINLRSKREIDKMKAPGRLVGKAHQLVARNVRPGVTTAHLDQVVDQLFTEHDAIPLFKGVPGIIPFPSATCISVNEEVVHGIPGDRVLSEGDIVSVDTGCQLGGWCGDAACTYPVGTISNEARKLLDVTKGVLDLSIRLLAEKSRWSDVAVEMQEFVSGHGCSVVECFVGHGIGREMHEDPQVPNYASETFRKKGDFLLRPGLVLAIEPMVNLGKKDVRCLDDHWTQVTRDGSLSAHFEHTVALTDNGPLILTSATPIEETAVPTTSAADSRQNAP